VSNHQDFATAFARGRRPYFLGFFPFLLALSPFELALLFRGLFVTGLFFPRLSVRFFTFFNSTTGAGPAAAHA
jgi:hypothetical protein